jgi:hypothetical protein
MPKFDILLKASLENVSSVEFLPPYLIRVRQTGGSEERDIMLDPDNEEELTGSRGTAHFKLKFDKKDKNEAYINVVNMKPLTSNEKFQIILSLECRGLDIVDFKPQKVTIHSKSKKTVFENEDLSNTTDGFSDFDEILNAPVNVSEVEVSVKGS